MRLPARPPAPRQVAGADGSLPATVPEASDRTREQKRFDRYDKDRNGAVTREEYLASRRKAYAKLDLNQDGQLSFDEWAAKTTTKFADADGDQIGAMNPAEFVKTAPKRAKTRAELPARCSARGAPTTGRRQLGRRHPLIERRARAIGVHFLAIGLLGSALDRREQPEIDVHRLIGLGLRAAGDMAEQRPERGRRPAAGRARARASSAAAKRPASRPIAALST